jgi:hypothetical protein
MNYFVYLDNEPKGPYTIGQLRTMWQAGLVTAKTPYCEPGYNEWLNLEILSAELEPPELLPVKSKSLPRKAPERQSSRKTRNVIIAVFVVVGITVLGWFTNGGNNSAKHNVVEPMAVSGIEALPPITVKLNNDLLNVLRMTDDLDVLYKRRCTSAEFIALARPAEALAVKLHSRLPKTDPRHDLLVNTFEGYQNVALVMTRREQGVRAESPDALMVAAGLRKTLLTKILEGHMTPEEKNVYYVWRKALTNQ